MSLQRVFETSRKLGIPVIITDPSGRDPMVVLPLEHFEAMAGSSAEETRAPAAPPLPPVRRMDVPAASPEIQPEPVWDEPGVDKIPQNLEVSADLAPEEHFYLEPVEDGQEG